MKNFDFILFFLHHWILLWFSLCTWKTQTGKRAGDQPSQTLNTKRSWAGLSVRPISSSTSSHRERQRRRLKRRVLRDLLHVVVVQSFWPPRSPTSLSVQRHLWHTNTPCASFIFLSRRRAGGGIRSFVLLNLSRNKQRCACACVSHFLVPSVLRSCCSRVPIWTHGFAPAVCFLVLVSFFHYTVLNLNFSFLFSM